MVPSTNKGDELTRDVLAGEEAAELRKLSSDFRARITAAEAKSMRRHGIVTDYYRGVQIAFLSAAYCVDELIKKIEAAEPHE